MNILEQLAAWSRQRVKNPLFMAFFFSWVAINHDYLFIMFSGDALPLKFETLRAEHFAPINVFGWFVIPAFVISWCKLLIAPLGLAILYIKKMPDIQDWLLEAWDRRQTELNNKQREIADQTLLSVEKSLEIQEAARKTKIESDEAIERLEKIHEKQTANLTAQINGLKDKKDQKLKLVEDVNLELEQKLEKSKTKLEKAEKKIQQLEVAIAGTPPLAIQNKELVEHANTLNETAKHTYEQITTIINNLEIYLTDEISLNGADGTISADAIEEVVQILEENKLNISEVINENYYANKQSLEKYSNKKKGLDALINDAPDDLPSSEEIEQWKQENPS